MAPIPPNIVLLFASPDRAALGPALDDPHWEVRKLERGSPLAWPELMRQPPTPIAAVIDGAMANALQLARQVQGGAPQAQLIFVANAEEERRLRGSLRQAPLVGANWVIQPAEASELQSQLRAQIRIGLQRARYRTTLSKINLQLAAKESAAGYVFQRLLVSERFLATLVESSPDAIVTLSLQGEILSWNASAEAIWGRASAVAIGCRFERLMEPSDTQRIAAALAAVTTSDTFLRLEANAVRPSGASVPVELTVSRVCDDRRDIVALVLFARDNSEHRLFLRSQRMESIGTLATGIAHNLNNMLTPIMMAAELLKDREDQTNQLPMIESIELSAGRAADLVQQLLFFGRGIEGSSATLGAATVIAEVTSMMQRTFPKNIAIKTGFAGDLRQIVGDQTQLVQVLLNLCVNARDAMPQGGNLAIHATNVRVPANLAARHGTNPGDYVAIEVADTGCGISPVDLERIFEPFFTTKEVGRGTGLGLSTALGIVRSHGGFLEVESELGRGSTFKVFLPAHAAPPHAPGADARTKNLSRGEGELLLLVDDESYILRIMSQILEKYGYRVLTAENGEVALREFRRHRAEIAAVFTDLMMPIMDGIELIRALRSLDQQVAIIAMSGLSTMDRNLKAREAGADDFLPKPCSVETLSQALEKAMADRARRGLARSHAG